ncbi:MAG: MBL fold metallo-hydrolase [Candidatus Rokubacteria bacterium]|nr:MBL fold metallo-hydrolase [Candidatus Rokubacteria bacterium]
MSVNPPIVLGEVTLQSIVEIPRSTYPTVSMLPESTAEGVARHHGWLRPHFWDEATNDLGSRIQSWVVRTPQTTVLIDTCVGNDKDRSENALWHRRSGDYLADLASIGVAPERVDVVLCTHLHVDHVGWNTRLVDGTWVPTFPRATYVMPGEEWEYWRYEKDECIADSVVPIVEAGRATLVEANHVVDPWLRFEPAPGHTPGHVCVRLATKAGQAVFSGDLMHRVVQVAEPQWSSRFCYDGKQAAVTRRAFVERHADSGTLILAAHFPRPGYIVRENGGHRFQPA